MARDFNGTTDYVEIDNSPTYGTSYTVSCWVKVDPANTSSPFIHRAKTAEQAIPFQIDFNANKFRIVVRDSAGVGISASSVTSITTNVWLSLCAIRNGNNVEVFFNGVSDGTGSGTLGTLNSLPDGPAIGAFFLASGTPNSYFKGHIAECAIWNVVLSDNEIASIAAGVKANRIRPHSLLAYIPIIGTSPEVDMAGTGMTTTIFGTPARSNHAPVSIYASKQETASYVENLPLNACINDYLIPV